MHQKLIDEGLRITEARRLILNLLSKSSQHMSADDVYFALRKINPSIGFATVYRTLDMLTRMAIVQKFDFGDGKARYELITGKEKETHHHHLLCTGCKKIINYTDFVEEEKVLIEKTEQALSKKYRFDIKSHIIHFYGLCEECRSQNQSPSP